MSDISIWAAKPPGIDPTTHFWFDQETVWRRICDGGIWIERHTSDNRPDFPVPCSLCEETYLADVLLGKKVLHLLHEPPAPPLDDPIDNNGKRADNRIYPRYLGGYTLNSQGQVPEMRVEIIAMPKVPIGSFARFYEARPAGQVRIVRDIRSRLLDPEGYKNRDYYFWLRNGLRSTHWSTRDIQTFRDALVPFLEGTRDDKKDHYRTICESYIDFWSERATSYFPVESVSVDIAGLTISVTPEVGMKIGDDNYALKIWLNAKPPTRPARQVIHYMMERASGMSSAWRDSWHLGIWDVRRKNILPPIRTAQYFELGLRSQAAAFLHLWNELDEQAQNLVNGPLAA